jgi:hypothetical protein
VTIDISALARNFCTAFFLCSLSAGSIPIVVGVGLERELGWRYDMGGDAEVAEDDGVAIARVDSIISLYVVN